MPVSSYRTPAEVEAIRPALALLVEALLVAERAGIDLRLVAAVMQAGGEALLAELDAAELHHPSRAA